MRCIVLVRATPESESETGAMPGAAVMAAIDRFNAELVQAGVMLAGEGLRPSREGRRVRIAADSRRVTDGPFAPIRELVAGFWLWQVRSMDEALEWARRCPPLFEGECEIEIRPLYEEQDFADALQPRPHDAGARAPRQPSGPSS